MVETLRVEKRSEGCTTTLQLSGRFRSDLIAFVRSVMSNGCARKILDLSDITLVDIEVVRFLNRCEDEGIEVVHCPAYVRKWMQRERAEGGQAGSSDPA